MLVGERQIVLLGDPGSGKSTLTQRLAALLAAVGCGDSKIRAEVEETESEALALLLAQMGANWLPIWIVLSRWAIHLSEDATGCADDLIQECLRQIGEVGSSPRLREHLDGRLQADPPTVLLLLDGLDEVTDDAKRAIIMQSINHFHQSHGAVPMMVTCRIRPYQAWQKGRQSLALLPHTLAPLEAADIERFVARWYTELVRVRIYQPIISIAAQERLLTALRDPQRKELREMATIPLLLTMMANVNYDSPLPNRRAQLYERFVQKLLYEWERLKQDDQASPTNLDMLLRQEKWDQNRLDSALNELAWRVHNEAQSRDTVDIPQNLIERILRRDPLGNDDPAKAKWAVEVLKLVTDRYGLINLVDRDRDGAGIYKFSHRTFQEYLAARRLATGDSASIISEIEVVLNKESWHEAILLAIGYLAHNQKQVDTPLMMFDEWLSSSPATEAEWERLLLIGEAYVNVIGEITLSQSVTPKRAAAVRERLIKQLTTAMQHPTLPPRQRLDAGLLLAELEEGPDDVDELVPVNAIRSPGYKFRIGKYPITNAQFRRFVGDGGYDDQQWWSEEGLRAKTEYNYTEPRFWDNRDLNRSSQPVVGVSWYEAEAYCKWLTAQLLATRKIEQDERVRLPTQAEWMAAVYAGKDTPDDEEHDYPWHGPFTTAHANTEESGLGQSSPVHMYPLGTVKIGRKEIWDLSGNVFEWTSDLVKDDNERAWVKGGAFYWDKNYAKASAADYWINRGVRNFDSGFRVVVVPISR